jgi:hypothetical protein
LDTAGRETPDVLVSARTFCSPQQALENRPAGRIGKGAEELVAGGMHLDTHN